MRLRPPNAPLDAFFGPVRRRHPDVDIVLLPPAPAPSREPADEARLAAVLARTADTAQATWTASGQPPRTPIPKWRFGPDDGTVVASARADAETTEGHEALAAIRSSLEDDDWRVRRLEGGVQRLSGSRGDITVQASYAEDTGALLLEVRSEPIFVGRAAARELVRQ